MSVYIRNPNKVNTKEGIIAEVLDSREKIERRSREDPLHSGAFYHAVLSLIDEFVESVRHTFLPENLGAPWEYAVEYSYDGIVLHLTHFGERRYFNRAHQREEIQEYVNQVLPLVKTKARYLTVEEYANSRGVGVGTVRQWIRRGRIRTAKKFGNEWRISELSDPPKRGFTSAKYILPEKLYGIPEDLQYLEEIRAVKIDKDPENKEAFTVSLFGDEEGKDGEESDRLSISSSEREKLELFLIGNPDIFYVQEFFVSVIPDLINIPEKKEHDN